jgi:hypothetical protein
VKVTIIGWNEGRTRREILWEGNMDAVPREGEWVSIDGDQAALWVTSVSYIAPKNEAIIETK